MCLVLLSTVQVSSSNIRNNIQFSILPASPKNAYFSFLFSEKIIPSYGEKITNSLKLLYAKIIHTKCIIQIFKLKTSFFPRKNHFFGFYTYNTLISRWIRGNETVYQVVRSSGHQVERSLRVFHLASNMKKWGEKCSI